MGRIFIMLFFFLIYHQVLNSQIVTIEPAFYTIDSTITITYDARQGNGGLRGVSPVYVHTGVITESGGVGSWQNVQGNWGTDDARVKMAPIGNDKHQLQYNIKQFYGLSANIKVNQLAFVFRNVDGSREGKTAASGDIFVDLPDQGVFTAFFQSPDERHIVLEKNESLDITVVSSESSEIVVYDNDVEIASGQGSTLNVRHTPVGPGDHVVRFTAKAGASEVTGNFSFVYDPAVVVSDPPPGMELGLNRIDEQRATILLYAPKKKHVFLISEINDYKVRQAFAMHLSSDGATWWIDVNDLDPEKAYTYQFLIDGNLKIADPLSELVLDPDHDGAVFNFGNLPTYPENSTDGRVSYFKPEVAPFNWTDGQFEKPEKQDLVIYELLMRDFLNSHSYADLMDTLTYLERLGVNAIELMPVQEFEANNSWGYNPSFHMALDKYYGSPEDFKKFVNRAHELGIAVVQDVVFNHAFGQSPLVQMYWDLERGRPIENGPYFNPTARHPFNVGYDFNHESGATKAYVKRVLKYWMQEYHIDGFRFDLSKGFTQKLSTNNDEMSFYDASRIAILKDYAHYIWDIHPDAYVILEHFASNTEERELAAEGMMLWGNGNSNFNEATMGYHESGKSDFSWQSYQQRGFDEPLIVGYMESHDEERLMYKNLRFGNSNGTYNVKELETALQRNAMAAVFFFSIPGPKMIWQFGELGYDFSINTCENGQVAECRLDRKPIKWDYKNHTGRKQLFDVYSRMIELKKNEDLFKTSDFTMNVTGALKTLILNGDDSNAVVVGNFGVSLISSTINFAHDGLWYDIFTGDSIVVSNSTYKLDLAPGDYKMYFDNKENITTGIPDLLHIGVDISVFPNPTDDRLNIRVASDRNIDARMIIIDVRGKIVHRMDNFIISSGANNYEIHVEGLMAGHYFLKLESGMGNAVIGIQVNR